MKLKEIQSFSIYQQIIILAVLYAALSYIFLQLAIIGTNASPVWPSSGLGFIAVWFLGYRIWPGIWLGAFTANFLVFIITNHWSIINAFFVSALIGIGNSMEALISVYFLRMFLGYENLFKIKSIFKYLLALLIGCMFSATVGTYFVYWVHPTPVSLDVVWFTWWLADIVGVLVVASPFLTYQKKSWTVRSPAELIEIFFICIMLLVINIVVFIKNSSQIGIYSHITYLVLPFAIWATYRFGFLGANLSMIITSAVSVLGALNALGPFALQPLLQDLLSVESYRAVFAITVLSLAAAGSERQEAEANIKSSEARFRSLVENSFEVIAMVNREGQIMYASPATRIILGYESSQFIGHSMFALIHPDDLMQVREKFQDILKTPGAIAYATCRLQTKSGLWRWVEGSGYNLIDDPDIKAVVINYRDVTEKKLYQERFEKMVDFSPIAKVMVNKNGEIKLVNKMTETLLGYTRDELFKMKIEDLIPKQFRGQHPGYREGFYHDPKARPMGMGRDLYALRKDGTQIPVEIGLTPIETEEGLWVLASIVDITKRKEAEVILKRDKESLAKLVNERSAELLKAQNELKQVSRLADIGTLAATVAHELRNPLGVIHLAAYNLKQEKNGAAGNSHLMNIEKKVWEGNQIIDNLLNYARLKLPQYQHVNLSNILNECIASSRARFVDKAFSFETQYEDNAHFIEADPHQLREIFSNILNNACQSMEKPGKIQVHVKVDGENLLVSIQDTGVGIAPEDIPKVFEPFFTRKSKGTGLGMTICNEMVHMHQGYIDIQSKLGEGTTVTVSLPLNPRQG